MRTTIAGAFADGALAPVRAIAALALVYLALGCAAQTRQPAVQPVTLIVPSVVRRDAGTHQVEFSMEIRLRNVRKEAIVWWRPFSPLAGTLHVFAPDGLQVQEASLAPPSATLVSHSTSPASTLAGTRIIREYLPPGGELTFSAAAVSFTAAEPGVYRILADVQVTQEKIVGYHDDVPTVITFPTPFGHAEATFRVTE